MHTLGLEPEILLALFILLIFAAVFALAFLLARYWRHIRWCLSPVTTERGTIRYVHASDFTLYWNRIEGEVKGHIHSAGITLEDGRKIKVYLSHEDYIMLRANSVGTLTRKGGRFISFVSDDPAVPAVGE